VARNNCMCFGAVLNPSSKNPLATDKEMLKYFSVHKDSLEYLVKKFYATESGSRDHVMAFREDKEVKDLMKKMAYGILVKLLKALGCLIRMKALCVKELRT